MNKKLLEEFNELAALTKYISEFYNYSGIRDDMDFIEHDNSWTKKTSSDHFGIFRFPFYLLADSRERTGHHNTNLK